MRRLLLLVIMFHFVPQVSQTNLSYISKITFISKIFECLYKGIHVGRKCYIALKKIIRLDALMHYFKNAKVFIKLGRSSTEPIDFIKLQEPNLFYGWVVKYQSSSLISGPAFKSCIIIAENFHCMVHLTDSNPSLIDVVIIGYIYST